MYKEKEPFVAENENKELPKRDFTINDEYFSGIETEGYGCGKELDYKNASDDAVDIDSGAQEVSGRQLLCWEGSAIHTANDASVYVRDSYIWGDTEFETLPIAGPPGNLLVSGNIRTTLGFGQSQNYYINSTVVSRNWAVLSTDGARPALQEGQKELSLFAYGSAAIGLSGGYGTYSDLFCRIFVYGTLFRVPEIGVISGTYGKVDIGTIGDGEKNEELSSVLRESDMALRKDKSLGSVIEAGRNALMIHSVNLPPYWEFEGYSKEEIPLYVAPVNARKTVFRTDLSLDGAVEYDPPKQAYIDHTAGSVILIKSTNTDVYLDGCELIADPAGTGAIVHTVYNNDTMFMNAVPDGEHYPGIKITMKEMKVKGDIIHEDYQRGLTMRLSGTEYEGAANEYGCDHWNKVSSEKGFGEYCLEGSYKTHHGLKVVLENGSSWKVTGRSTLTGLRVGKGSRIIGKISLDGREMICAEGETYEGEIVIEP